MIIDLIVNITLDYLEKAVHYLSNITADIQGGDLWKTSSENFKQNPWKVPKKLFIFGKVAGGKNEFIHAYFSRFFIKV